MHMSAHKNIKHAYFPETEIFKSYAQDPIFMELEDSFSRFERALAKNISELDRIDQLLGSTKYTSVN